MKATAHTANIVIRSGIGKRPELELTEEDRNAIENRKAAQAARLARIAARRKESGE